MTKETLLNKIYLRVEHEASEAVSQLLEMAEGNGKTITHADVVRVLPRGNLLTPIEERWVQCALDKGHTVLVVSTVRVDTAEGSPAVERRLEFRAAA